MAAVTPWAALTAVAGSNRVLSSRDGAVMHALLFGSLDRGARLRAQIKRDWDARRQWQASARRHPADGAALQLRGAASCAAAIRAAIRELRAMHDAAGRRPETAAIAPAIGAMLAGDLLCGVR